MIHLHSKNNSVLGTIHHQNVFIAKLTTNTALPTALRTQHILLALSPEQPIPEGFGLVLIAHDTTARGAFLGSSSP